MGNRFISSDPEHQISEDWETLHEPAAETVTGTGTLTPELPQDCRAIIAMLDVTAAATEAGNTLDVFIQTLVKRPTADVWVDVLHFTQVVGNGGTPRHYDKIVAGLNQATFENGAALGGGAKRHLIGEQWRCRWVIVDVAVLANQSFTFSVNLQPM